MDETKRKQLIIAGSAFFGLIIVSLVIWLLFFNKNDSLPPVEPPTTAEVEETTPPVPDTPTDEETVYKNDIAFKRFDELSRYAITNSRIDVIRYFLATYAQSLPVGTITTYTLDKSSVKETKEGDTNIITFSASTNASEVYKVELSYTFAADAYVRVFDKNGTVVQTSPYDAE
jgi:hypothetical protein